jgi:hypothetical protein
MELMRQELREKVNEKIVALMQLQKEAAMRVDEIVQIKKEDAVVFEKNTITQPVENPSSDEEEEEDEVVSMWNEEMLIQTKPPVRSFTGLTDA